MYMTSVPEKVIMERSGHLTKEGVRSYQQTSFEQVKQVSPTLAQFVPSGSLKENDACALNSAVSSSDHTEVDMPPKSGAKPVDDALKALQFQAVHGGTFNIHVNFK